MFQCVWRTSDAAAARWTRAREVWSALLGVARAHTQRDLPPTVSIVCDRPRNYSASSALLPSIPAFTSPVTACRLTYLDLVPPMPVGTLGSSLTSERTIHRSVFSLFPCHVGYRQVFLECSAPWLLWTSSSSQPRINTNRSSNLPNGYSYIEYICLSPNTLPYQNFVKLGGLSNDAATPDEEKSLFICFV